MTEKIVSTTSTAPIIGSFKVLKDFEHEHESGGKSGYMAGSKYHIRKGNDELIANVKKWRDAGKVV